MKRNLGYAVLLAILCALFAVPAVSQTATVKGVCKDGEGNPLVDAQVVWHNKDNGRTINLKTNKKGEYFSLGIEPGAYTVTLNKDGKQLDSAEQKVGSDEVSLDFDVKKAKEEAVQQAAKQQGLTPEQVKQKQEEVSKAEKYNTNARAVNEKLNAATAATKLPTPDYDQALALLNEAKEMAPNEDVVWARLAATYLDSAKAQTDAAEKTKRNTEAYNDIQKAVELKKTAMASAPPPPSGKPATTNGPTDNARMAQYYDNLGAAASRLGKFDEAVNAYKQATELDPTHAGHYFLNIGISLMSSGSDASVRKQAVEAFDKAIAADPSSADAYYFKGQNLLAMSTMQGNKVVAPEGTSEALQKYLELQPNGPHAADAKGMLAAIGSTVETTYGAKKKK